MLLSFFVILVPIGILGNILYSKITDIVTHSSEYLNSLKNFADQIKAKTGYVIVKPQNIDQLGSYLAQLLPKVLGVTMNTLALIAAMYFILYFMLVNGRRMEEALYEYIPLKDGNVELIGKEFEHLGRRPVSCSYVLHHGEERATFALSSLKMVQLFCKHHRFFI